MTTAKNLNHEIERDFVTATEAALIEGVGRKTIQRDISSGLCQGAYKYGREMRIPKPEFEKYRARKKQAIAPKK